MAETPQDVVNRELREFRRYTGDGLPGEPVNAPLPVGDPQSGVHNPKKVNLRNAMKATLEGAAQSVSDAKDEADRADAAADRAENSASSFIEVATNFKTVAALLADETMGYAGSGKDVLVGEGDIVTAQGFRYEVAASGATDAYETTAGGVKLYEAGFIFTTLQRFKDAIARGATYPEGATVLVDGATYRFLDDGNTTIDGLTGWALASGNDTHENVSNLLSGGGSADWRNITYPLYVAHRGMEIPFPENTLIAFEEAAKAGAKAIELDARLTADRELLVMHDATTGRTCRALDGTAINLSVHELNKADIYGLDASFKTSTGAAFFGSDFRFNQPPFLRDVFSALRGKVSFIVQAYADGSPYSEPETAQAIADLAYDMNLTGAVMVMRNVMDQPIGFDPKGCRVSGINFTGTPMTATQFNAAAAFGYDMVWEPKEFADATQISNAHDAGLLYGGFTYYPADVVASPAPDALMCADTFLTEGRRLSTAQDYLLREYPGPGYIREGGYNGGSPGNVPICYPVIRTVAGSRFIGWDAAHPTVATGRSRFGIANLDPDPDNDGIYTLDFDMIWTELTASTSELSVFFFELDKAGTLQEGAASSIVKNGYGFGVRANGGLGLYKWTDVGAEASAQVVVLDTETGGPNPPTLNTPYPCRIAVTATAITATFDVGGMDIVMTANDTTHRGGKYLQFERRGHGVMIGNLRRS